MYGNRKAMLLVEKFINSKSKSNLALIGPEGVGKEMAAYCIASRLLGCEQKKLKLHPDFIFIEPDNGKIKVEQVNALLEKCMYSAAEAERKVVLINDAQCMNSAAQNKILKEVEECNQYSTFIFVSSKMLLDTIMSRCVMIPFQRLTDAEMMAYFAEVGETETSLYLPICNGSIGNYVQYKKNAAIVDHVRKIIEHFEHGKRSQIINVCGQMVEKDKNGLYECFGKELGPFFNLFEQIFYGLFLSMNGIEDKNSILDYQNMERQYSINMVINILDSLQKHAHMYQKGMYSRTDFFRLIRLMAA